MISLISTVLNEAHNVQNLLEDIKRQNTKPDEVVFVDAGSSDGTLDILTNKLKLIVEKGCGRSEGRNLAISSSTGDIIAVCDAGTRLDESWLRNLTAHFSKPDVHVVSGFFKPQAESFFEKCLASATIPILDEIEGDKFLPSSRSVAFRKSVWESISGYPEWLPVCEDLVFDLKLKKKGYNFVFEPSAIVFWKPRSKVSGFFRQYFSYGRGDGHAKLWFVRHMIRYTAYSTGILLIYLSVTVSGLWLLPFFAAQLGYFSKFYYRYLGHFSEDPEHVTVLAFLLIPLLVIVGDLAKMVGYPFGVYERLAGKIRENRI